MAGERCVTSQTHSFFQHPRVKHNPFTGVEFCHVNFVDGKGRWVDNALFERLWRTVKYEGVYLRAYMIALLVRGDLLVIISIFTTLRDGIDR